MTVATSSANFISAISKAVNPFFKESENNVTRAGIIIIDYKIVCVRIRRLLEWIGKAETW